MNLAINGGPKVRTKLFPNQSTIGEGEIEAANRVLKTGILTGYQGNAGPQFFGGTEIQGLEREWGEAFGDKDKDKRLHCCAVNSCTSGLFVACGAIGIRPGDEVIVSPYSMTCSATAPLIWGGVPVFADIDPRTFNLNPEDVERKITPRTKAIIVVDLFGLPYDKRIDEIAKKHDLVVIEDAAQALGAEREGKFAGTLGHIGVFSFNQGKHLTCGEGGMVCSYDEKLMGRCRLIMNHAEAVINDYTCTDIGGAVCPENKSLFGFNLRMTEVNAAIMRVQLDRSWKLQMDRAINIICLTSLLKEIPGLSLPHRNMEKGFIHTFYVLPMIFDEMKWGIHRDKVVKAVKAELMPCAGREGDGVTIGAGYIKPIWRMPVFLTRNYSLDMPSPTPVCDRLWRDELIIMHRFFGPNAGMGDMEDIAAAFKKVWDNRKELK